MLAIAGDTNPNVGISVGPGRVEVEALPGLLQKGVWGMKVAELLRRCWWWRSRTTNWFVRRAGVRAGDCDEAGIGVFASRVRKALKLEKDSVIHSLRHTMLTRLGETGTEASVTRVGCERIGWSRGSRHPRRGRKFKGPPHSG